ncbi:MAG: hypothetical protein AAGC55_20585, partial [Myxococcota bacterium]
AVDEGEVTITGMATPEVGTCAFDESVRTYVCSSDSGNLPAGTAMSAANGDGIASFLTPTEVLGDVVGTWIELSGFTNEANNGRFEVIAKTGASVSIVNSLAIAETLEADAGYRIVTGFAPTEANRDFLGDPEDTITITKAAGEVVEGFTVENIGPSGNAGKSDFFTLAENSILPYNFPNNATSPVTFSCDPAMGGNCGQSGAGISGLVITGRTTDAELTGLGPTDMPDAVGQFATFTCTGVPGAPSVVMDMNAVDAVISTTPTRVETQILRVTADLTQPQTTVVVGHQLIGYTDF